MLRACAVLLVAAAALGCPTRAEACKCASPPSVADALRTAGAVFEGRVSKLTPLGSNDLVVELSVIRTWKDAATEHILLRTRQDAAACGFPFAPGESFLIYADAAPSDASLPGLEALRCGRTKPMSEAEADIIELGMGSVPVSARKDDLPPNADNATTNSAIAEQHAKPAAGGCASCSALGRPLHAPGAGSAATLTLLGAWTLRRRRRSARGRFRLTP
jgi:hypothetical protein